MSTRRRFPVGVQDRSLRIRHGTGSIAVVQKLEGFYPPARIRAWLGGMNAHLGNRSPLYLIRHGDTGEVIAAIHAIKAGAFA